MGKTGLVSRIYEATINIDAGRKGFTTKGKEQEGRISYEKGIAEALSTFREEKASFDPQTIIVAEYTFISQELDNCSENDTDSIDSLTQAVQSFDDAFLALKIVANSTAYQYADHTHPHSRKYRVNGFPKDSFHIACISHKTRLQNILRSPGIDPIEKALLKQRFANLSAAQNGYLEKQKKAMAGQ